MTPERRGPKTSFPQDVGKWPRAGDIRVNSSHHDYHEGELACLVHPCRARALGYDSSICAGLPMTQTVQAQSCPGLAKDVFVARVRSGLSGLGRVRGTLKWAKSNSQQISVNSGNSRVAVSLMSGEGTSYNPPTSGKATVITLEAESHVRPRSAARVGTDMGSAVSVSKVMPVAVTPF